ncbi:MAG: ABC transporter ATP-binding protein [Clostridia bacterium]|nr:ABC transporter ATP-binding protein [Clostridia bacterium]
MQKKDLNIDATLDVQEKILTEKQKQRLERKQQKLLKKDEAHKEKYGLTYSEVLGKMPNRTIKYQKGNFSKFFRYFSKYWVSILFIVLISIIAIGTNYLVMPLTQNAIDSMVVLDFTKAIICCALLAGAVILNRIFSCIQGICFGNLSAKGVKALREDLAQKALSTKSQAYKLLPSGEIVYRVSTEPADFSNSLIGFYEHFDGILNSCAFLIYFSITNIWIGLAFFVVLIIDMIALNFQLKGRKYRQRRSKLLHENMNSYVNEFVRGSDDVKSLNLKQSTFDIVKNHTLHRKNNMFSNTAYNNVFDSTRGVVRTLLVMGIVILGVYFASIEAISIGMAVLVLQYRSIPAQLSKSINNCANAVQDCKISCERLAKLYDNSIYPQENFGYKDLANFKGNISFKNVSFGYGEQKVLDNISFEVPANHSLGIVGKSGEGKSTILGLVNRLNDCDSGEILLDGVDNKELTEEALRNNVCLVPQMPYIFNTTIRENLKYAKQDATEEEMVDVLKKAQFYDFVMSKPDGLDTIVGEGGVVLSGGQRQRLAIARAFLTPSKVLMLDEATSALDNENQEGIKNVIKEMKNQCSFIIVAHRLSTIVDCDEIIVLDGHKIVAKGTHQELMKHCPIYIDLYKLEKKQSKE